MLEKLQAMLVANKGGDGWFVGDEVRSSRRSDFLEAISTCKKLVSFQLIAKQVVNGWSFGPWVVFCERQLKNFETCVWLAPDNHTSLSFIFAADLGRFAVPKLGRFHRLSLQEADDVGQVSETESSEEESGESSKDR